ncbi:MAG: ankyrin repeat domain-containing protein [Alistipes sp.]|nr:ankyrin repeat domain-containing protein [Alistipes sp.]
MGFFNFWKKDNNNSSQPAGDGIPKIILNDADNIFLFLEKGEGGNGIIQEFLRKAGIDARDYYGRTPLWNAVFYKNNPLIKWLLDNGADINARDRKGIAPLHIACIYADIERVQLLVENGADVNAPGAHGNSPIMEAHRNWEGGANEATIIYLYRHGADIMQKNDIGISFFFDGFGNGIRSRPVGKSDARSDRPRKLKQKCANALRKN